MVDVGELLGDIKKKIVDAEQKEQELGREEQQAFRYLDQGNREDTAELFSREVGTAQEIAQELGQVEKEELKVEEVLKDSRVSREIQQEFEQEEQKFEDILEKFLEELEKLRQEADQLGNAVDQQDLQKLKGIIEESENLREQGEKVMSRRNFVKKTAAAAAGTSMLSGIENPVRKAVRAEKKRASRHESSTSNISREISREASDVRTGRGKVEETLSLPEIKADIKMLRTAADAGLAIVEMRNTSGSPMGVSIEMKFDNMHASGTYNVNSGGSGSFTARENLSRGESFSTGAIINKESGAPGEADFVIETPQGQKAIALDFPRGIITSHAVRDAGKVSGLDISTEVTGSGEKRFEVNARNNSSSPLLVDLTFGVPSGWSISGGENIQQGATGVMNTTHELGKGDSDYMAVMFSRQDQDAPVVGTLAVTVMEPGKHPEEDQYLIPVDLR